jgi:hypothetical protein
METKLAHFDQIYRGYTIRKGLLGDWFVGNGQTDRWASCHWSEAAARAAVDTLVALTRECTCAQRDYGLCLNCQ